jgi:predicted ATP-grasp superfamily ATP-dependent carboligase
VSAPLFIAGASVRAAAQSAVRAGCTVTAADLFGDRDLAAIAVTHSIEDYPEAIRAIADIVPPMEWMYTGGLENYPDLVDAVSARHRLLGNPGNVLRQARDPWELAAALQPAGLPFPGASTQLSRVPDERWLIKPLAGSGGGDIRELLSRCNRVRTEWGGQDRGSGHAAELTVPRPAPAGYYFQPWIRGNSLSAVYAADGGGATLLCVTRQLVGCAWAGARGFEYVGSIGPLPLAARLQRTYELIGAQLAQRWDLRGLFGVDTVLSGANVWTIEVNPRFPASVEVWERATGASAVACHRAACGGVVPSPGALPRPQGVVGKAIINAPVDVVLDAATCEQLELWVPNHHGAVLADLPRAGQRIPTGGPVFTVFAEGRDYSATYRQLRTRAVQLRETLRRR